VLSAIWAVSNNARRSPGHCTRRGHVDRNEIYRLCLGVWTQGCSCWCLDQPHQRILESNDNQPGIGQGMWTFCWCVACLRRLRSRFRKWLGSKFWRNSFRSRARNIAGTGILTETSISFRSFPEFLCVTDEYQRSLMLSNRWYDCHIYVASPSP
jgi:hypothetical protein